MPSTITNLQSGSLEDRREGVDVRTKEQQFNTSILRLRQNSSDLLVFDGRVVQDNFFDENLLDKDISGAITTAPNPFSERRTLGQSNNTDVAFTEMIDFDPTVYIADEGLAMFPAVLSAAGYYDPIVDDGSVGVFETRAEIAGVRYLPNFAKRGPKASLCFATEGVDKKSYLIEQTVLRDYTASSEKSPIYFEAGDQDVSMVETTTYQDQESSAAVPFIDDYDVSVAANLCKDSQMKQMFLSGSTPSPYLERDRISSSAGWTFLNVSNGTDSIVYSDRM